jgi:hypothetical protein
MPRFDDKRGDPDWAAEIGSELLEGMGEPGCPFEIGRTHEYVPDDDEYKRRIAGRTLGHDLQDEWWKLKGEKSTGVVDTQRPGPWWHFPPKKTVGMPPWDVPSFCGDGTCDANEDCANCPDDCGECPPPYDPCTENPCAPLLVPSSKTNPIPHAKFMRQLLVIFSQSCDFFIQGLTEGKPMLLGPAPSGGFEIKDDGTVKLPVYKHIGAGGFSDLVLSPCGLWGCAPVSPYAPATELDPAGCAWKYMQSLFVVADTALWKTTKWSNVVQWTKDEEASGGPVLFTFGGGLAGCC